MRSGSLDSSFSHPNGLLQSSEMGICGDWPRRGKKPPEKSVPPTLSVKCPIRAGQRPCPYSSVPSGKSTVTLPVLTPVSHPPPVCIVVWINGVNRGWPGCHGFSVSPQSENPSNLASARADAIVSLTRRREWWNGRHARLRIWSRKGWRFKSSLAHHFR